MRLGSVLLALCAGAGAWQSAPARAADEAAAFWAVTGVAADDALNMRDAPHGDSKTVGRIPPAAHGLKALGCLKPEPSFDRWATLTPAERANAKLEWCRVEYQGQQGWVAGRFLKPDGEGR